MPDISMCQNKQCPLRKGCYRYRAIPSGFRQAYGLFEFDKDQNGVTFCKNYSPLLPNDQLAPLD